MMTRQRSCGVNASVAAMFCAEAARLRWRSGTILGREVVPEVCSTSATSSGPGCAGPASANGTESVKLPAGPLSSASQLDQRNLALRRDGTRGRVRAALDDQRLGVEIAEIEIELVGAIGGVERRGRRPACHRDEGGRHLRPVRHHHRDRVALIDAERAQRAAGLLHQAQQLGPRHGLAVRRADRRRLGIARAQQVGDGLARVRAHLSPITLRCDPAGRPRALRQPARRSLPQLRGTRLERTGAKSTCPKLCIQLPDWAH